MENIGAYIKNELAMQASELAKKIVDLQYERQPEFWNKFGKRGKEMSLRDAAYHLPFLGESIETGDKTIFTNYIFPIHSNNFAASVINCIYKSIFV